MTQRKRKATAPKAKVPVNKNNGFYRAFEERFRGPRTVIKKRLEVYLPFVGPLLDHHQPAKVLDLGCGRGEWLELMRETGFEVEGVDLDDGMLQACIQLDLPVIQGEGVAHLKKKESASLSVVSAFHVAEHISFEQLNELVAEALRVLKPGGLLILETPNPENLVVTTSSFYLDPTHQRPIPPQLLAFIPEHQGFKRTKILRLQESEELSKNPNPSLLAVLNGVSPDYSVIAQKTAPKKIFSSFDEVFSREYGLSLDVLASRCDARLYQVDVKAGQAEAKAGQAEAKVNGAEAIARQALNAAHHAETVVHRVEEQLMAVYNSRSWRITQPLRSAASAARWFKRGTTAWLTFAPHSRPRRTLRLVMMHLKLYVSARPRLKSLVFRCLTPFPSLLNRIRRVGAPSVAPRQNIAAPHIEGFENLSPRARQIYTDLKAAIEQHKKEAV